MVVRKLKAAIYERVLAHSLCNAVTSTGSCGTPFRRRADSVLTQFLRLLSLMSGRCPHFFISEEQNAKGMLTPGFVQRPSPIQNLFPISRLAFKSLICRAKLAESGGARPHSTATSAR